MKKLSIAGFLVASLAAASGYFGGSTSSPPSGPAGGDLTGTYPNPTLAVDRVRIAGDTMSGTLSLATGVSPGVKGLTDLELDSNATTYIRSAGNTRVSFDAVGNVNLGQPYNWGFVVRSGDTMTGALALNGPGTSPSTVPYLDASRVLQSSAITPTELGYLTGLTGNVQAQLNSVSVNVTGFVAKTGDSMSGDLSIGNSAGLFTNRIGNVDSFIEMISMDATNGVLRDLSGVSSLVWTGRKGYTSSGVESFDWSARTLRGTSDTSIDWGLRRAYDSGVAVVDWSNESLYDATGALSVAWDQRQTKDTSAITSVDWENRQLIDATGDNVFGWSSGNVVVEPGSYITGVTTPINPNDAANKAYVDSISVNVSGTANTLAGFNNSGDLYSAPHWGLDADGKIAWNDTFATGVTVPDGVDIGLYGTFQSGSVNNNRTFIRMQPSYESGSSLNSLLGYHFAPTINTTFTNYYAIDHAVTLDGSANGSGGSFFNVHDLINTGAQLYNGYVGGSIDITVNSASYVNGYTAFQDTSDFLAGASVSGLNNFNVAVQVGATVNGGHLGYNFNPAYLPTSKVINGINAFLANPNIQGDIEQFYGMQVAPTYQAGSTPNGHVGYWHTPQINASFSNNGGYNVFDDGASFNSGSFIENPNGLNLHTQFMSGSTMSGNFNYVNITPGWQSGAVLAGTSTATMIAINPTAPAGLFDAFTGLSIGVNGVTLANGSSATGINNGGLFTSNYDSRLPSIGYVQFNYLGGSMTVPSGSPVSNTLVFGLNAASSLNAYDNIGDDGSGLELGTVLGVGFVGAMNIQAGVTVDTITMALAGAGAAAGSGHIENFNGVYSAGVLPQGGTPTVGNMKAFRASNVICLLASNCRGLSIEDPLADNYLASTITLDGLAANTVPYLDGTKTIQSSAVTDTELGYLSGVTAAIQTQLNAKQSTLTTGNLTGSGAVSVSGGTGAVIGAGASISVATADLSTTGVLTSTDFATFNAVTGKVSKAGDTMTGALLIGATTNALKISNPPAATGTNLIAANTVSRSDSTNAGYMSVSATSNPIFEGAGYGNATTRFRGYRASGGDPSAPAAITGSGGIAQLEAFGHDGTSFESGAGVFLRSTGTWSTSDHRTNIQLLNTLQGTTTLVTSLQVGDLGDITMGPSGVTVNHTVNGGINMTRGLTLTGVTHGIAIKEGTNARMGVSTLVAGTVTVNTTSVTANSRIMLTGQNSSGTHGDLTVSARTAGTSFTITSTSALDTRDVAWIIFEPSP